MCSLPRLDRLHLTAALAAIVLSPLSAKPTTQGQITQDQRHFFETKIRPVLVKHCYECHSHEADIVAADYSLDSPDGLRSGGASGESAVVPGKPDKSSLIEALRYSEDGLQMPPSGKLPSRVVADFERWVAMGAPDPRAEDSETLKKKAQQKLAEGLWSLQPPVSPAVPQVQNKQWPQTPVDHFVLARLESESLRPVEDADPAKLIRRLYFDLVGIPPTPEEVRAFTAAPTSSALAAVVDHLLESPQFGERWGRHWLDVARYAESSGMEFNFTYPHAWPYRDYVIDSFNEDKPYDRFITEQLAGDLLPADSPEQGQENQLATGFLSIGPKRHNAGTQSFRSDIVDDQVRATSEAFLALTVGCARCHDHKFDPVPTEDYYALAGIFQSTETLHGTTKIKYSRHPADLVPFGSPNAQQQHEAYVAHQEKIKKAQQKLDETEEERKGIEEKLKAAEKRKQQSERQTEDTKDGENTEDGEDTESLQSKLASLKENAQSLKETVKQLNANAPKPPKYGMGARDGDVEDTHVAIGGDPGNKGDKIARGFLSNVEVKDAPKVSDESSGRLTLARWIASRHNPLTARVMVNRVWHHLFGRGLVPTVNNFGVLGEKPSHPELLDHLAVRFMDEGWSVKRLIRSIVLSRVYGLSTKKDPALFEADPQNVLLWRMTPRRLEVEPLRDAILAVSGQLDRSRPEGSSVTELGQQLSRGVAWEKLNPQSHRRTVYLPVVRHYAPHMLQEFDFAASSLVVGDRAETTTAQQALFFLNNEFMLQQARATARLLIAQQPDDVASQVRSAYQRALSRNATRDELARAKAFIEKASRFLKVEEQSMDENTQRELALASFVQALFGSAEFRYLIHPPETADAKMAAR